MLETSAEATPHEKPFAIFLGNSSVNFQKLFKRKMTNFIVIKYRGMDSDLHKFDKLNTIFKILRNNSYFSSHFDLRNLGTGIVEFDGTYDAKYIKRLSTLCPDYYFYVTIGTTIIKWHNGKTI